MYIVLYKFNNNNNKVQKNDKINNHIYYGFNNNVNDSIIWLTYFTWT